jgi:hypothetical protein
MVLNLKLNVREEFKMNEHNHECYCGTGKCTPHEVSKNGCVRFITDPPDITEGTTLYNYTQQRGYYQHQCGFCSTHGDSVNSLECDW